MIECRRCGTQMRDSLDIVEVPEPNDPVAPLTVPSRFDQALELLREVDSKAVFIGCCPFCVLWTLSYPPEGGDLRVSHADDCLYIRVKAFLEGAQ